MQNRQTVLQATVDARLDACRTMSDGMRKIAEAQNKTQGDEAMSSYLKGRELHTSMERIAHQHRF